MLPRVFRAPASMLVSFSAIDFTGPVRPARSRVRIMRATASYAPAIEHRLSSPSLRMAPALTGSVPALLDGARWYHSCCPGAELPSSTALLDPRTVPAAERVVEAVRDAEGGREVPGPASRPRIPAVTAPVLTIPAVAPSTPDPAKGR